MFGVRLGLNFSTMNIPENLLYTKDHEWIKFEDNHAYIGITDFAQGELGDIVFVDINTLGENIKAGDVFGSVEAVKTVSDLYMPISAEVLEVNPVIESTPETINSDAYGEGWIIKVRLSGDSDRSGLISADEYKALLGA